MAGLAEVVAAFVAAIKKLLFREGMREAIIWLFRGSPLTLRVATLGFLVLSLLLGIVVWSNVVKTDEIVRRALSSPIESTLHPSSALEALLLASILPEPDEAPLAVPSGPQYVVTDSFKGELKSMEEILTGSAESSQPSAQEDPFVAESISPANGTQADLSQLVLSDRRSGFLFIPGAIFPSNSGSDVTGVLVANRENYSIFQDIKLSKKVSGLLCGDLTKGYGVFDKDRPVSVFGPGTTPAAIANKYAQAYLIFRSGVTRLCESSKRTEWQEQRMYYANKFTTNTLLQRRPYFEPTVRNAGSTFFYATEPYIDLGGNGAVKTFCHYLPVSKKDQATRNTYKTDTVICFDFPLSTDLQKEIRSQLSWFGGIATEFSCENAQCTSVAGESGLPHAFSSMFLRVFFPATEFTSREINDINTLYQGSRSFSGESAFFGDVTNLNVDKKPGIIEFILPLGGTHVLAVKVDIRSFEWWRTLWISLTAVSVALTFILAVLILADYGLKFKEQERAFAAVDTVMSDVPSPYARLDEDGKFLKVNDAFANLQGYRSAAEATPELKKYEYMDFLYDQASKDEYLAVRKERLEKKTYRSYLVQLWTGGQPGKGLPKWIRVHGWNVPTPHTPRNKLGESFGILIPTTGPGTLTVLDSKSSPKSVEPKGPDQAKTGTA